VHRHHLFRNRAFLCIHILSVPSNKKDYIGYTNRERAPSVLTWHNTHTHTHTRTHAHTNTTHTYTYLHTYVRTYTNTHTHTQKHITCSTQYQNTHTSWSFSKLIFWDNINMGWSTGSLQLLNMMFFLLPEAAEWSNTSPWSNENHWSLWVIWHVKVASSIAKNQWLR